MVEVQRRQRNTGLWSKPPILDSRNALVEAPAGSASFKSMNNHQMGQNVSQKA